MNPEQPGSGQPNQSKNSGNTIPEYILATLGGLPGGFIGLIASPLALHLLGTKLSGAAKWGAWAAVGVIGAPISAAITLALMPGNFEQVVSGAKQSTVDATGELNSTSTSASSTSNAPTAAPTSAFGLQEKIVSRDRAITVMEASTQEGITPQNQFADPITGTVVLVGLAIENTGSESGNMMFSSFTLTDSQGRKYDELDVADTSWSLWKDEQGFKSRSEDLYPGEARMDVVAFRVAPDAAGFTMEWKGNQVNLGI